MCEMSMIVFTDSIYISAGLVALGKVVVVGGDPSTMMSIRGVDASARAAGGQASYLADRL